jgi:hypothetical protein
MKVDTLNRRLATLEGNHQEDDEFVPITFQWFNNDGTPRGRKIKRLVPRRRWQWLRSIPNDD